MEDGSNFGRIPVKGEKQAMEWSLVLASQGFEPVVNHNAETQRWELLLPAHEVSTALRHLRLYRIENRGWPWQQPVFDQALLFDWGCLAWLAVVALFYALTEAEPSIKAAGRMDGSLVLKGEWWHAFTAIWLHGDAAHLASNLSLGIPLLGLTMGRYGTGLGALAACLTGAAGNLFAMVMGPHPHVSLGASGLVMGCLGLVAIQSWPFLHQHRYGVRYAVGGLMGGIMLFVLLGLSPGTDILAHLGGFLAGLLLGAILSGFPSFTRHTVANLAAGFVAALLILIPWWLAFRGMPA